MPKKVKLGLIISVLLVLGFVGYAIYKAENYNASFIEEVNPNITTEERKTYEERLGDINSKLEEINNDKEQEYNLYMQIGFSLYGLGKYSDSVEAFEEAIKLKREDANAYVALFEVQQSMENINGAHESIKTAIRLNGSNADIWKKYIQFNMNKLNIGNDQISSLYSEAVIKTNNNIDIITSYAAWLESVGNYLASKEYWQKAIQQNSNNKQVYENEIRRLDQKMQ